MPILLHSNLLADASCCHLHYLWRAPQEIGRRWKSVEKLGKWRWPCWTTSSSWFMYADNLAMNWQGNIGLWLPWWKSSIRGWDDYGVGLDGVDMFLIVFDQTGEPTIIYSPARPGNFKFCEYLPSPVWGCCNEGHLVKLCYNVDMWWPPQWRCLYW